jgi:tetratricopeptide (TPR) repeat protein
VLPEDAVGGRIDTLSRLASAAWWPGDLRKAEAYTREALALAEGTDRRDLQAVAVRQLVWMLELRLDFDGAEKLLGELGPAGDGVLERAQTARAEGSLRRLQGRLAEAIEDFEEARALFLDAGLAGEAAWVGVLRGWIALVDGDTRGAEHEFRHAVRVFTSNEDHGHLCEAQRALAEVLLETGQVDEAERYALAARSLVSGHDLTSTSSTTRTLGLVRAAQGRYDEAERLLREALSLLDGTDFSLLQVEALVPLIRFLRARGRDSEADELATRLPDRAPGWLGTTDAESRDLVPVEVPS